MIADVVRRFAVRDLPEDFAFIQIDRADASIRRLRQRQALNRQSAAGILCSRRRRRAIRACVAPAPPLVRAPVVALP